jgi:hypothetical protein
MQTYKTLPELLSDANLIRKVARQMCLNDGVNPDETTPYHGKIFHNYEHHTTTVFAVLKALKTIAQ